MVTPNVPPCRIVIDVPLDSEPRVVDDGGLAPYLVEAICQRIAMMNATTWAVVDVEEAE